MASTARPGKVGYAGILLMLIDTETNSRPASAAAAPASATRKFSQPAVEYPLTRAVSQQEAANCTPSWCDKRATDRAPQPGVLDGLELAAGPPA